MSTKKLSQLVGEIWDRAHHVFPSNRTSRTILTWMLERGTVSLSEVDITIGTPPGTPAWGTDADQVNWGEGLWG